MLAFMWLLAALLSTFITTTSAACTQAGLPLFNPQCCANTYNAGGLVGCTPCGAGRTSPQGGNSCSACPAGSAALNSGVACTTCIKGSYAVSGSTACTACPFGQTTSGTGSTSSADCRARASGELRRRAKPRWCPGTQKACAVPNKKNGWECTDTENNIESCGGCQSEGGGQDCTALDNVLAVGCVRGTCVFECPPSFNKTETGCVELKSAYNPYHIDSFAQGGNGGQDVLSAGRRRSAKWSESSL